jgi:hypothetical protein
MRRLVIAVLLLVAYAVTPAAARPLRSTGIVTAIDDGAKSFDCHWRTSAWVYATGDKTVFLVGRKSGSFSDLKVGALVKVDYHLVGKDRVADRIVIGAAGPKAPTRR